MIRASVGLGSCGLAAGGRAVREALLRALAEAGAEAPVEARGCLGPCYREVLVELESPERGRWLYGDVTPEEVPELVAAHLGRGEVPEARVVAGPEGPVGEAAAFLAPQERVALQRCGTVDPESLDAYRAAGGYAALESALRDGDPAALVEEVEAAGLRGRGGAGFPTGAKWELARAAPGDGKVVICNADEGDPGAFMDRNLLEGDPFSVLEGMTLGAFAVGASSGRFYVRDEYPLAVRRLERAVGLAREAGWLGRDVAGSGWSFDVTISRGAGAFVCGEETALIASLEGRRGTPRLRPPFPVERGLFGRPTVINNVETWANVPWIVARGAAAYRRFGTETSRGTKVFSLAGDVRRTGMVEVPMGTTLRRVLEEIGGGSRTGRPLKAVQIGGPSGGCLPADLFDTPVDYESLAHTGAIMGSGGLVALDECACLVDVARYFLAFTQRESCGKCTFCRLGTKRMLEVLDRLCAGRGRQGDLGLLESLGRQVQAHSLCGLGRSAPNPVLTTLRYFRDEYEAHLAGRCPSGRCRELIRFRIDPWLCDGCTRCLEQCAVQAVGRDPRLIPLSIDAGVCSRCGGCRDVCQFGAVEVL